MDDLLTLERLKTRIRQVRTEHPAMTPEGMAEVAGVSASTIRRYDNPSDRSEPGLLGQARIGHHYGISLDYLAYGAVEPHLTDNRKGFRMMCQHLEVMLSEEALEGFSVFVRGLWKEVIALEATPRDIR